MTLKEYALNSSLSFICYISFDRTGNEKKWYNLPYKNQSPLAFFRLSVGGSQAKLRRARDKVEQRLG